MGRSRILVSLLWSVFLVLAVPPAGAAGLDRAKVGALPGDPAPPIHGGAWLRGTPVEKYEPGRLYVVDLWATWCAPCLATMPLLRRYEARFPDRVTVVAMNVWEMSPDRVRQLLATRADSIPTHVVADSVPAGKQANEGLHAAAFMGVSDWISIPRTYLIDGEGRVAWVGTPHELEQPLAQVMAGTWDRDAHAREYARDMETELRFQAAFAPVQAALMAKHWDEALKASEAVVRADTSMQVRFANAGFAAVADAILRQKAASAEELQQAERASQRALELGARPRWRHLLMAARIAKATGKSADAERLLGEARRLAPAGSAAEVPASVEALSNTR